MIVRAKDEEGKRRYVREGIQQERWKDRKGWAYLGLIGFRTTAKHNIKNTENPCRRWPDSKSKWKKKEKRNFEAVNEEQIITPFRISFNWDHGWRKTMLGLR
ncbi:hypothetical protein Pfo_019508 [Paulownia fortunei]|nr:hypothetical protein Pfo_019508 [Paulownia fortunei]